MLPCVPPTKSLYNSSVHLHSYLVNCSKVLIFLLYIEYLFLTLDSGQMRAHHDEVMQKKWCYYEYSILQIAFISDSGLNLISLSTG